MTVLARILWIAFGLAANAVTVFGVATYLISAHMTGFNTSQTNLSNQMTALQGSLDTYKGTVDKKVEDNNSDLAGQIAKLSQSLDANSTQLASLNATMAGFDKRLNDTIARQERVEAVLLKQHILYNPPNEQFEGKYSAEWTKAGVDVKTIIGFDDARAIADWLSLSDFKN